MAARTETDQALPRSHFFITVARGRSARTFVARSELTFAGAAFVPLLILWFLGSTFFLLFHDDLVTALMLRQRDLQYSYEDRIAVLRGQLDRETTRQLVSERSVETKLGELTARESELRTRSGLVAQLEDQASRLGATTAVPRSATVHSLANDRFDVRNAAAPSNGYAVSHDSSPTPKPRPEAAVLPDGGVDTLPVAPSASVPERVSMLSTSLDTIETMQGRQIAALDTKVQRSLGRYREALATAGLSEARLATSHAQPGLGGPFVPLMHEDDGSPFARAAVGLQLTMSQAINLNASMSHVPLAKPLRGDPEITSPFGPRIDPFLGRAAMHTGVDLSEDTGTEVRVTAPGRVTVAGPVSGYGIMVEVDHGAGLSTRYAHLSEADVSVGETVRLDQPIGLVGATGRATGPHLHYETRIDGEAVDPIRFMAAGQRLQAAQSDVP